jgi:CRISPR-associated protein Csb1
MSTTTLENLEQCATDPNGPVALRLKQKLTSIECVTKDDHCILYPPTYADIGYNIDTLANGKKVALVDSVGSQANRMEPEFKSADADRSKWLVPQIEIALGNAADAPRLSLLDLAHRGADAVVQSSGDLAKAIREAFSTLRKTGDAGPLCTIAPTSLVFGVWDSRGGSSEKRPRLVRSIIRAWDVEVLHAAAQFNSVWKELDETQQNALQAEAKRQKKKLSVKGFADAPATFRDTKASQYVGGLPNPEARVLGGVLVHDSIERDVTINLVALRGLKAANDAETLALKKYLLGLALTAATADLDLFLREGCHLRYTGNDQWYSIPRRGDAAVVDLTSDKAKAAIAKLASNGAEHFRPKWPKTMEYIFDIAEAKKLLAAKEEEEVTPE